MTPTVTNDQRVFMDIKVAKESQGPPVATTDGVMFSIISRKAETQVLIGDGETAVIAGLVSDEEQITLKKVPFLGDIPVVGELFKHRERAPKHQEILVFVTPTIVEA